MRCPKLLLCVLFAGALAAQSELPDGEGKALVVRMCGKCHGLESVTSARNSEDRWGIVVDDMVSRGAKGTDDEIEIVIQYLINNFGPNSKIKVNKAAAKELSAALGLSAADADAIVQYRGRNGAFKELGDLKKVPGIDTKKIEQAKDRIEY